MKIKTAVKTAFSCGGGKHAWLKTIGMLVIILLTSAVNAAYAVVWGNLAQEPVLFEGTLLENIRLGNAAITEERLREWYNGSEMRKVFSNTSGGENAVICQEGANLSLAYNQWAVPRVRKLSKKLQGNNGKFMGRLGFLLDAAETIRTYRLEEVQEKETSAVIMFFPKIEA